MEGIVCSYRLELGVFNGLSNFPKGHHRQIRDRFLDHHVTS